jgi:hypothetical protein
MTSKFLKNSVNYSEINQVKKILKPLLEKYNDYLLTKVSCIKSEQKTFIVPNNNKKYYSFIINKGQNYKTLYFFPEKEENTSSDFFLEIDSSKLNENCNNCLLEGYMYSNNKEFLITDMLINNNSIITSEYSLRYSLLKTLFNETLLNGHLYINIHNILPECEDIQIYNIFKANFKYGIEINSMEYINDTKVNVNDVNKVNNTITEMKQISKGNFVDMFVVNNIETLNNEGILYVKTLSDSKYLRKVLKDKENIILKCKYNNQFKKWQVIS